MSGSPQETWKWQWVLTRARNITDLCDQPRQIGQLSTKKITLTPVITDKGLLLWCAEASLELKNEVLFRNDVVRFMRF